MRAIPWLALLLACGLGGRTSLAANESNDLKFIPKIVQKPMKKPAAKPAAVRRVKKKYS